ncbi:cuticular protein hypothetical 8 precursor [Bombyx mori]|uniref:Putative cuticle protein n=1 Tax=Bombyx mori TaxID=7091 RepID=C0H6G4_BOMMO|nr:cuticular protein hypothetical 8 precursor [Bombyx mori]FAA00475.1 TPA: putative cuticle protein [Bombyx mori]
MKSMVVLFALASVACGSFLPVAQPPHHPAVVLDPHGRPLDTAEVINARALHLQAKVLEGHHAPLVHAAVAPIVAPIAHSVIAPAAVSHQSRVDVRTSPAIYSHAVAAPVLAHAAYAAPVFAGHGHGHWLKKRSLGHLTYSAPIIAPAAVSHQSRVDVISSPAVVSHAVATPVVAHAYAAPVVAAVAPAAVSHQSRVDVRTSPAVVAHGAVAPYAHGIITPYAHHAGLFHSAPLVHSSPLVHGW